MPLTNTKIGNCLFGN